MNCFKGLKMIEANNIGVLTVDDTGALFVVDTVTNGLVYCHPLTGPRIVRVVLPGQFWVLFDGF
jgi:hypothetical protein